MLRPSKCGARESVVVAVRNPLGERWFVSKASSVDRADQNGTVNCVISRSMLTMRAFKTHVAKRGGVVKQSSS